MKADELVQVWGKGAEAISEFDFFLFLRFGAKLEASSFLPVFEERRGSEALERDPRHEVHLAEAVGLEYVQRPAFPLQWS